MRWMLMVVATTVLISPAMAQQDQSRPEAAPQTQTTPLGSERRDQIRSELRDRIMQRFEQRLADFKSALRLTPEQEANWSAFESGVRDFVRLRAEQLSTMRDERPTTPVERLRQRAERLASTSTALKRLADVEEALYTKLTDAQKDRFGDLAQLILRPGPELEDRERASERDEFQVHDSWKYRYPRHMRDEDNEDWRERMMGRHHKWDDDDEGSRDPRGMWRDRDYGSDEDWHHHMMRRHHKWDDDDEGARDRRGMRRDRDYRSRYRGHEGAMRDRWHDDCHPHWLDTD